MSKFKAMKFKVNSPEHSEQIQKCLFQLGYMWRTDLLPEVRYTQYSAIMAYEDGKIYHSFMDEYFSKHENTEYFLEDLEAMLAEQGLDSFSTNPKYLGCGHLSECKYHGVVPASMCPCTCSAPTMTQFIHQLQKRLEFVNLSVNIYSDEIQVSDMDSTQVAKVSSYEELIEAIKVKEQYSNTFKGD